MSRDLKSSEAKHGQFNEINQASSELEVIESLTYVLDEANRQQEYRRHQVDTSIQLSLQLIGFASLTSPLTAISNVQVQWLKYVALLCIFFAVIIGLFDIFNPRRIDYELPLQILRDDACIKSKKSVILYQIDNKIENEKKAREDENRRIRLIKWGYLCLGMAVFCTLFSIIDYCAIFSWFH
ncbi:hypothetical protein GCM10007377_01430 [Galliscardovia ingluviei]|uniref:Transmembrane protein n=1 Tax=Galliscardovia ingluviei TaxID=1769422 RepID=A0A8J3EWX6_9BIFI|nr:hypothetical protein [Galliscardovia ingluviei]GGI12532.1 hypothetical protein GCM10007377_01430 [Galliscardovia ingluviei]